MPNPIEHVVIIFKENHTFDNYFASFPGANGTSGLAQAPDPVADTGHDHGAWLAQRHGQGGRRLAYSKADIAAYWAYAQQYTLCDNYFTDVASQSEPNHLLVIAADAPIIDNASSRRTYQPQPPFALVSLPANLTAAGRTWRNYYDTGSSGYKTSYFEQIAALSGNPWNVKSSQFATDVSQNILPDVAWLFPPEGMSEHPGSASLKPGVAWTVQCIDQIAANPDVWAKTAVFITWDDWGGWYDHVDPLLNRTWTGGGPRRKGYQGSQFRYGYRVPCLVISPYAKQGLNHTFNSHVSIVKFCLRLFNLPAWSAPALAAGDPSGDLWDCFAFDQPPRLTPPSSIPT
jgi:phospholipase C